MDPDLTMTSPAEKCPEVSVIMPVYKAETFLAAAIQSILDQTFSSFELILIGDDLSKDTRSVLEWIRQDDERVIVLLQEERQGLAASLNRSISVARGEYIARMDADDISVPERLAKQVVYLKTHPECSLVAAHVEYIDEAGAQTGFWHADRETRTATEIRRTMPRENCIAHPTIMIRRSLLSRYRYDASRKNTEDYDLWLRLLSDNHTICKLPEVLVQLRIHDISVMAVSRRKTPGSDKIKCKLQYLKGQILQGKINGFNVAVLLYLLMNMGIWPIRYIQSRFR